MKRSAIALSSLLFCAPAYADFNGPGYSIPFVANGGTAAQSAAARAGQVVTPFDYGAYADTQRTQCSVTLAYSSSALHMTGTGCAFTTADVGKYIVVQNAGAALATGSVTAIPVTSAGSGYTSVPSVTLANTGSGSNAQPEPLMGLAAAAVVSGGTGCPNGTITFNLPNPYGTQAVTAQVSGTVSGGVLSGSLTVVTAGAYEALPSTSAAALASTSTACTTAPTVSSTWNLGSVYVESQGVGYVAGVSASVSAGNATVGTPTVSFGNSPLATTISGYIDGTDVTLAATAANPSGLSAAPQYVAWGHDDEPAIYAALYAISHGTAHGYLYIPPSPSGYWGVASQIVLDPNSLPTKIVGAGTDTTGVQPAPTDIVALATMAQMVWMNTGYGGAVTMSDIQFDGFRVATNVGYLECAVTSHFTNVDFRNPASFGIGLELGQSGSGNCPDFTGYSVRSDIDSGLYTDARDEPYYNFIINSTDSKWFDIVGIGASIAYIETAITAANTALTNPHPYGTAQYGYVLNAMTDITDLRVDGCLVACVAINSTYTKITSAEFQLPRDLAYGVEFAAGVSNVWVNNVDCSQFVVNIGNCYLRNTPVGTNVNTSAFGTYLNIVEGFGALGGVTTIGGDLVMIGADAGFRSTGNNNTIVGAFAGEQLGSGSGNTVFGEGALSFGTSTSNGGGWTAIGNDAFEHAAAGSSSGTAIGSFACAMVTTGQNDVCIGSGGVGSTTLTTGDNDILIGTSSVVDTIASSTSHELNVGNVVFANLAATANSTVSCGASPSIDSYSNGKSGKVTCGSGAVATGTITFSTAYQSWNHCRVTPESTLASFTYSYSLSAITINATSLTSAVLDYDCDGV